MILFHFSSPRTSDLFLRVSWLSFNSVIKIQYVSHSLTWSTGHSSLGRFIFFSLFVCVILYLSQAIDCESQWIGFHFNEMTRDVRCWMCSGDFSFSSALSLSFRPLFLPLHGAYFLCQCVSLFSPLSHSFSFIASTQSEDSLHGALHTSNLRAQWKEEPSRQIVSMMHRSDNIFWCLHIHRQPFQLTVIHPIGCAISITDLISRCLHFVLFFSSSSL